MKLIDGHALAGRLLSDAVTDDQRRQANMIAKVIEEMPSAQPEIIRCKDCIRYHEPSCLMAYDGKEERVNFVSAVGKREDELISLLDLNAVAMEK